MIGQQWQEVDSGNGAVSVWNNDSKNDMYLYFSSNAAMPKRSMLSYRNDSNRSQIWFLYPTGYIQRPLDKIISDKPHQEIGFEDVMVRNKWTN